MSIAIQASLIDSNLSQAKVSINIDASRLKEGLPLIDLNEPNLPKKIPTLEQWLHTTIQKQFFLEIHVAHPHPNYFELSFAQQQTKESIKRYLEQICHPFKIQYDF